MIIHTQVCPELVPLVEAGELDTLRTRAAVEGYLSPLSAAGIDELVLGCTHYPFLRPLIEAALGPDVDVIDPAPAVARQTARVLAQRGWLDGDGACAMKSHIFYTSGDPARFGVALHNLLGLEAAVCAAAWASDGRLRAIAK